MGRHNPFADPNEAPPDYKTAQATAQSPAQASAFTQDLTPSKVDRVNSRPVLETAEDPYAFLSSFDTVFVIDDSWSMLQPETRWKDARKVLKAITKICVDHDEDGIDVFFLNTPHHRTREH